MCISFEKSKNHLFSHHSAPPPSKKQEKAMDHRGTVCVLMAWLGLMSITIAVLGEEDDDPWFYLGPSETLKFLNIRLNTWTKWCLFNLFSSLDVMFTTWGMEKIRPWIINSVCTLSNLALDYPRSTTMQIVISFSVYEDIITRVIWLKLALLQIDIIAIRIVVDNLVTAYTTWNYIKHRHVVSDDVGEVVMPIATQKRTRIGRISSEMAPLASIGGPHSEGPELELDLSEMRNANDPQLPDSDGE